ncbi:hypothetical protein DFQ27_006168 [Actinomortierella ambigua]|uniref:Uncharacterized protein n=1 Tax=Actinomortierella ambigua TaxID=1343610 RepID=A0A9P6PZA5_9FUNG|nr:hypothetical protein DFQ27_006168 [Actinomortierella ambigua]
MSSETKNNMGPVQEANEEAIEIFRSCKDEILAAVMKANKHDHDHGTHMMDELQRISEFTPIQYAVEDVSYGLNYFGKIHVGNAKYIHARVHKNADTGKVNFHSIHTEPHDAVWDLDTPLKYFTD